MVYTGYTSIHHYHTHTHSTVTPTHAHHCHTHTHTIITPSHTPLSHPHTHHTSDPPLLRDGLTVRVDERDGLIPVDLALPPLAFPIPSLPQWTKDGSLVNSDLRVMYNYSKVLFHSLQRSDSGLYSLSATNHRSNGSVIGSDTGSFTLEVLCE